MIFEKTAHLINNNRMLNKFLEIVQIDTGADLNSQTSPSSKGQLCLAKSLSVHLQKMGLQEVQVDEHGILTATFPGNIGHDTPVVGLIAHLDTSPDVKTGPVHPLVHTYEGGDIPLNAGSVIKSDELKDYMGHTIITSDGTTLLGADDKAGIAEIIEAMAVLQENPQIKHPTFRIAFTPDEEIGHGTAHFDVQKFGADVAYTLDGLKPNSVDSENFNAFNPIVLIKGKATHTGYAYQKMVNALQVAVHFLAKLPVDEDPSTTKGRQGFYNILGFSGTAEEAKIVLMVRDFDDKEVQRRVDFLQHQIDTTLRCFPGAEISMEPNQRYSNMKQVIAEFPEVVALAKKAIELSDLNPEETLVRGGTDGATLSFRGLLTPNLGAGGENFHSVTEFVSLQTMSKCVQNIVNLAQVWALEAERIMPKVIERRARILSADPKMRC